MDHTLSDKDLLVNTILRDELNLEAVSTKGLLFSSFIVGITALIGALIPLAPFLVFSTLQSIVIALVIGAFLLFAVGAYKALTLVGSWWQSGLQMLLIGMLSAFAGFFIGLLLKVN